VISVHRLRSHRFKDYSLSLLRRDLISGLIVGIIAIPLGMAFAIAAGVEPQYGIYTTIIAGLFISLFGGSKFQIGGPTGAFIPILFGIVISYGYDNLLIAGFMAGIILLIMGLFRLGSLIKYVPRPVTIGFTTGIAVIIFTGQIANFLGLSGVVRHEGFIDNMKEIFIRINTINPYSFATAAVCLITLLLANRFIPKIPSTLIGLALSTAIAAFLFPHEVATIGSTYGAIPNTLPAIEFPDITLSKLQTLIVPALLIALLGGIESLLSAMVADGMTGDKHNSNRELIGQGIANMITPLFGGIPATGAIARTATNIKSGAASPMSGIIHSAVVLLILLLFAPYASHIPLASMAPILMVVALNMSERRRFLYIFKMKSSDTIVLLVTFLLTVFANLTIGVGFGLLLAFILFIKRMSRISIQATKLSLHEFEHAPTMKIYDIEGVLFFGAAQDFEQALQNVVRNKPRIVLLNIERVLFMDVSGISYFSEIIYYIQQYGGTVLISGKRAELHSLFIKTKLDETIGSSHFFNNNDDALRYVRTTMFA
jgi:SulP family sulfate permease